MKFFQSFEDSRVTDRLCSSTLECQAEVAIWNLFRSFGERFLIKVLNLIWFEVIFLEVDPPVL